MQLLQNPSLRNLLLSNVQPDSRMDVADQESNERNETGVERFWRPGCRREERNPIRARKTQTHGSTKTPNPKQHSCSTLTTQSWQHHINRQSKCGRIGEHMLLKAHEVMTHDRPIKYLSRQYLKVHTHGRRRSKSPFTSRRL